MRKIIHLDMDAFYASVEQRDNPALRGKPVVVGGSPNKRGVVAAASYEARQYGIYSAMSARTAVQRCPHLIFARPRFEVYRAVSEQIHAIFHRYTDQVEPLALDEAYLDVTENKAGNPSATRIAQTIKAAIHAELDLTASAGVSINKFLAKVASGLDKPNGLYVILPEQAAAFVEQLAIEKFYGIGQVTAAKMHSLGIQTGADLKQRSEAELVQHFGKSGRFYYRIARAQDDRPVQPHRVRKSIGAERTFEQDLDDLTQMHQELSAIAQDLHHRLVAKQATGHTLTLKVKYADFQQVTRSRTFRDLIQSAETIVVVAQELLVATEVGARKVRLLGLTISQLSSEDAPCIQLQIPFDDGSVLSHIS